MARFTFVDRDRAFYPVNLLCAVLKGVRPGFYTWRTRPPSQRAVADPVLAEQIHGSYTVSRCTYGVSHIHDDLPNGGVQVGRKRIARIMRDNGWHGAHRRAARHHEVRSGGGAGAGPARSRLHRDP